MGDAPVVHVTQGTVATEASDLIVPTIQALANEAVLVVATTGGQAIEGLNLESVPANVRLEPFIPHAQLLPYVDVMVTNGGFNGVQMALASGVPIGNSRTNRREARNLCKGAMDRDRNRSKNEYADAIANPRCSPENLSLTDL